MNFLWIKTVEAEGVEAEGLKATQGVLPKHKKIMWENRRENAKKFEGQLSWENLWDGTFKKKEWKKKKMELSEVIQAVFPNEELTILTY